MRKKPKTWRVAQGERIYAIGDIHGCEDLFAELISLIRRDNARRPPARTHIVLLGDVVDRGAQSASLVKRLMAYTYANRRFVVLKGNHEQMMHAALAGDSVAARAWLNHGGLQTLRSWGIEAGQLTDEALPGLMWQARQTIPIEVREWLTGLRLYLKSGNVVFVHAGLKPGVALHRQDAVDLLWIRDEFRLDQTPRRLLVVHGHTIREAGPDVGAGRIGIDTGAYRTGRLTCLGLEADQAWSLCTDPAPSTPSGPESTPFDQ